MTVIFPQSDNCYVYHTLCCAAGSGDLLADNFNPAWFLLERHRFSTFDVGLRVITLSRST